jgi:ASC-1-like (ASCH) protein
MQDLADAIGVDYEVETYSDQQAGPVFRQEFLATLGHLGSIGRSPLRTARSTYASRARNSVMVKGGDWAYGCQLVDEAFAQLPGPPAPSRVLTPMVLTDTGAKLSKPLIRDGKVPPPPGARRWMLDVSSWDGDIHSYVDALVWLVGKMLADPKHFYRSYTTQELDRLMTGRPTTSTGVRAREMNLYRRYFDLVAAGRKTIEVRVRYPNLRHLAPGQCIRFLCGRDECLTRVKRVSTYDSFEEMFDREGFANVNPDSPRDQQLANIRRIYGPEKEALGVLAIEIELISPAE